MNAQVIVLPRDVLRLNAALAAVRSRAHALQSNAPTTHRALNQVWHDMQAGRSSGWAVSQAMRLLQGVSAQQSGGAP